MSVSHHSVLSACMCLSPALRLSCLCRLYALQTKDSLLFYICTAPSTIGSHSSWPASIAITQIITHQNHSCRSKYEIRMHQNSNGLGQREQSPHHILLFLINDDQASHPFLLPSQMFSLVDSARYLSVGKTPRSVLLPRPAPCLCESLLLPVTLLKFT